MHTQCQRLLTQRQAEAQSPCKVQGACGLPEARQLRVWQRLGQLEDARHVLAIEPSKAVLVEAVSEGGEQLSASKAVNMRGFEAQSTRKGQALGKVADALQ